MLKEKIEMYYNVKIKNNFIYLTLKETGKENRFILNNKSIYLGYGLIKGKLEDELKKKLLKEGKIDLIPVRDLFIMFSEMSEEVIDSMIYHCDVITLRHIKELENNCSEEDLELINELKDVFVGIGDSFVCRKCNEPSHYLNFKGDLKETIEKLKNGYCEDCLKTMD